MPKDKTYSTEIKPETAILIGLVSRTNSQERLKEYLDELAFLIELLDQFAWFKAESIILGFQCSLLPSVLGRV